MPHEIIAYRTHRQSLFDAAKRIAKTAGFEKQDSYMEDEPELKEFAFQCFCGNSPSEGVKLQIFVSSHPQGARISVHTRRGSDEDAFNSIVGQLDKLFKRT